jgi:hypothetical protein
MDSVEREKLDRRVSIVCEFTVGRLSKMAYFRDREAARAAAEEGR